MGFSKESMNSAMASAVFRNVARTFSINSFTRCFSAVEIATETSCRQFLKLASYDFFGS